jgi:hypothetical protein
MNQTKDHDAEHAVLLEGSYVKDRLTYYGRYEWVQKSVEELSLDESKYGHDAIFPVNALTVGMAYELIRWGQTRVSVGGQLSLYRADQRLDDLYGSSPVAAQVYLRIYPNKL